MSDAEDHSAPGASIHGGDGSSATSVDTAVREVGGGSVDSGTSFHVQRGLEEDSLGSFSTTASALGYHRLTYTEDGFNYGVSDIPDVSERCALCRQFPYPDTSRILLQAIRVALEPPPPVVPPSADGCADTGGSESRK